MTMLSYETPGVPEASVALRRLTLFIFFMCLARIAQDLIWPVGLWRLPEFRPTDLATGINWWYCIEPKIEFAARALLCAASGWLLLQPRRAWRFVAWSAIAFCVVAGSQDLLMHAASIAHQLNYLQGLAIYHRSTMGLPGLFVGAATGLVWACGATLVFLGLMQTAGRTPPLFPVRSLQWIACAVLVPLCLWSFTSCLNEQSRAAAAERFSYLMSAPWSIPTLGVIGDILYSPIYSWINLPAAVAAAVALATRLRCRRPLLIALWSLVAILLTSHVLLTLVVLSEYLGWSSSGRFGVGGNLLFTIQWISSFARSTLDRPAYFIACLIVLSANER